MNNSNLKFVIVGHVDHGKSTLIGRLLYDTSSLPPDKIEEIRKTSKELGKDTEFAYLLDNLEEERQQGVTIDTTQVFFKTDKRNYVIIDAPGHVEFVKNMITGASQADAALLIVDAKEGIKEQTKRHSTIISLLGLEEIVVVINKMDLVNYSEGVYNAIKSAMEGLLGALGASPQFYIPISALKGDNITQLSEKMPWYVGPAVLGSLDLLKNRAKPENRPLIFPIQDIYKIGEKRIAVGRVERGAVAAGQEVQILPEGTKTKITSIEKFLEDTKRASVEESVGVTTEDAVFLERGCVLCGNGGQLEVNDSFYANIFWMSKRGYSKGEKIILRCATQEISCRIESILRRINSSTLNVIGEDDDRLENLEIGEVIIKTKKPIVIDTFKNTQAMGRFVLVANDNTVAGGIITGFKEGKKNDASAS